MEASENIIGEDLCRNYRFSLRNMLLESTLFDIYKVETELKSGNFAVERAFLIGKVCFFKNILLVLSKSIFKESSTINCWNGIEEVWIFYKIWWLLKINFFTSILDFWTCYCLFYLFNLDFKCWTMPQNFTLRIWRLRSSRIILFSYAFISSKNISVSNQILSSKFTVCFLELI